jgi:hypothetical protein
LRATGAKAAAAEGAAAPSVTPSLLAVSLSETGEHSDVALQALVAMVERDLDTISQSRWNPTITARHVTVGVWSECDYEGATDRALTLLGVAPSDYDLISVLLPTTFGQHSGENECRRNGAVWKGLAYLGGKYAWVRLSSDATATATESRVWVHELVHNMGLGHSNTPEIEYGDRTCVMGNLFRMRDRSTLNGAALQQLGWASAHPDSGRTGTIVLRPLASSAEVYQIGSHLVSFRHTLVGHDATLRVESGVSVHRTYGHSRLLLGHGAGTVTADNLTVTVHGLSSESATVEIATATAEPRSLALAVYGAAAGASALAILVIGSQIKYRGTGKPTVQCPDK